MENNKTSSLREMMKAVVYTRYGEAEVLKIREIKKPVEKENGVLVRVHSAALNPYDRYLMRGRPYIARIGFGLFTPNAPGLGQDFSGEVVAVGSKVTEFKPGDKVFGDVAQRFKDVDRAFAEYVCVSESTLVLKPENITFEEAAAAPMAARTALQALQTHGKIKSGDKALINGASGGVGTYAVQLARWFGAEVTAVCSSRNVSLASSLGATRVVDYSIEDFTQTDERYDLIIDIVSSRSPAESRRLLTKTGRYIWVGSPETGPWLGPIYQLLKMSLLSLFVKPKNMIQAVTPLLKNDLELIQKLLASGEIKSIIDRSYPLEKIDRAMNYLGQGHAKGKVVISIGDSSVSNNL